MDYPRGSSDTKPDYLQRYKETLIEEDTPHIHAYDKAHALMLTECCIISRETGASLLSNLRSIDGAVFTERLSAGGGIHSGEKVLTRLAGADIAGYLGLARSSGDLSAVVFRLTARERILTLLEALCETRACLIEFADTHRETIIPGTTHGQHAQPTTLGHWALMADGVFMREQERLVGIYDRFDRFPGGSGIMTGTDFPIDRARIAELLGFTTLHYNTMDAILSHDVEMEYAACLSSLAQSLARIGDDLMLWSSTEHGLLRLPGWFCGTSSLMPQKRNPDGIEDWKSLAAIGTGIYSIVQTTERGSTGLIILERRNSMRLLRELAGDLTDRLAWLPRLFTQLEFDAKKSKQSAGAHWSQASDIAAALVSNGLMNWRIAHHFVAQFVRRCLDNGIAPDASNARMLQDFAKAEGHELSLSEEVYREALDVEAFVRRRNVVGAPGADAMTQHLEHSASALQAMRNQATGMKSRMEGASQKLDRAIDDILAG